MIIILASASPRRQELLKLICDDFEVYPSGAEEVLPDGIEEDNIPEYLAELKAREVHGIFPEDLVIGCDTAVFSGKRMLGKPSSREEAKKMLTALSGRRHKVITGCVLMLGDKKKAFSVSTEVEFYPLSDREIEEYVASGESDDKAGAYAIQGKGAAFVKSIAGDYYSVVGLPVAELKRAIEAIKKQACAG